jgi:hypothetical protein
VTKQPSAKNIIDSTMTTPSLPEKSQPGMPLHWPAAFTGKIDREAALATKENGSRFPWLEQPDRPSL